MTDLTEANLKDYITAIQKHMEETDKVMAIKPNKVMCVPDDLEKIGLTHEDVLKMIKENT
jgi:uncharacterized protein YdeI (YjbR/CyaY-like superfamily)